MRTIPRLLRAIVLLGLLGANRPSAARDPEQPRPSRTLPAPEHLTPQTRAEIRARMGRHGATMSGLVQAVVLLDRPTIRTLAGRIADEEMVARANAPLKSGQPLPLPLEFFAELDALREAARQLAVAAVEPRTGLTENDRLLADRFAALTRTCVGCHSAYLRSDPAGLGGASAAPATPAQKPAEPAPPPGH